MPLWSQKKELVEKRRVREVRIDIDGEEVVFLLRSLTAREWLECVSAGVVDGEPQVEMMQRFVAYSLLDETGSAPLANEEGVVRVSDWDAGIVRQLFEHVSELNGMAPKKVQYSPGIAS